MSPGDGDLSLPGEAEASSLRDLGRLPPKAMRREPTGQGGDPGSQALRGQGKGCDLPQGAVGRPGGASCFVQFAGGS